MAFSSHAGVPTPYDSQPQDPLPQEGSGNITTMSEHFEMNLGAEMTDAIGFPHRRDRSLVDAARDEVRVFLLEPCACAGTGGGHMTALALWEGLATWRRFDGPTLLSRSCESVDGPAVA